MNKNLSISIVTPTFNRGDFLEKNILSIKNQDYLYIEHLVQDGVSTDSSIEILKKYEKSYNLKWVSEKDAGCANAMNKGFARATGDIFCWLDSDDFYLPGTITKVMKVFQEHPEVDVVFGDLLIADYRGTVVDHIKHTDFDIDTLIYLTMSLNPQATFWRKSLHGTIGQFDETLLRCADADFFIRMGLLKATFYHMKEFLSVYRMHDAQLTKSVDIIRREGVILLGKYKEKGLTAQGLRWKRHILSMKRVFKFIKQGDWQYALRGIFRRIGGLYLYKN